MFDVAIICILDFWAFAQPKCTDHSKSVVMLTRIAKMCVFASSGLIHTEIGSAQNIQWTSWMSAVRTKANCIASENFSARSSRRLKVRQFYCDTQWDIRCIWEYGWLLGMRFVSNVRAIQSKLWCFHQAKSNEQGYKGVGLQFNGNSNAFRAFGHFHDSANATNIWIGCE